MDSGYSIALPVFLGDEMDARTFLLSGETIGTAFPFPGSFMLTAGHVGSEILAARPRVGVVGLKGPQGEGLKGARVTDVELLPGDLAVLKVEFPIPESARWFHTLSWKQQPLSPFDSVRTMGFPYGTLQVDEKLKLIQRVFQGHIVSRIVEFKPVGAMEPPFGVYELSFAAPVGLSGAPLLNSTGKLSLHGVVIGNSESKMLVFHSQEVVGEPRETTFVEHHEVLRLGIAVTANHVLNCTSTLLGGSVRAFLNAAGRLA